MTPSARLAMAGKLVGRTIIAVEWNAWNSGNAGVRSQSKDTQNPVLILDNGARVHFSVDETETGAYGVAIQVAK